ncbi:ABC transporter substrate-binding protein [Actinophytocola oryzae]|uniref:Peptide/nickel transport system substrate-binding protein n=1 Tax=Actinophytocola oryzae TaxID=502181 RepID=A0A4R7VB59_9PSEU|nr:ABC transporter substrate-binding protein [Actinophytocola oryzae]TDV46250.1 peptide/nickel transport system substrate-binding protein [Actinophytocola oryzae]
MSGATSSTRARLVVPLLAVALVGACTGDPAPPASGDPDGTSLVIAVADEPTDLSPIAGYGEHGAAKLYDGLVEYQPNLGLRPALATDPPEVSADGLSWTVPLRPKVTFTDGSPFEAQDVVATYRALLDPARNSPLRQRFSMLENVTAVNVATVRFDLSAPYAPFPELLTLGIVSSESVGTDKPVGTGPYKLESWIKGGKMVLKANTAYWDDAPAVTKVTVEFIPDDETRADRLREGKLDSAALPPAMAAKFEDTDGLRVVAHSAADVRAVTLPSNDPVTGDPDLRLALNYAVNREALVDKVLDGKGLPAYTPMPEVQAEFFDPDATFPYDLTRALDALSTGGWEPGVTGVRTKNGTPAAFTLRYRQGDSVAQGLAETFVTDARAIGVEVTPEATADPAALAQGPALVGFGDPFDPDTAVYPVLRSGSALGGYHNETVDDALDTGRAATDPAERATAYRKLQRAWVAAPGMVVLAAPNHTYVMRESWDGYQPVVDASGADATWGAWWNLENWTPR